jgi:hypothetical protein
MTTFQILSIIISALAIAGAIVGVYVTARVAIAKIEVKIVSIEKDLFAKELAICRIEKDNREDFKENRNDHKEILEKVDKLVETLIK